MTDLDPRSLSEDPHAGLATPLMDLIAAVTLTAIALFFLVEALRLPVPGGVATAPGLLPFLTAASLLIMSLMLGAGALARRRTAILERRALLGIDLPPDFRRTMALGAILTLYVAALQFVPIDVVFTLGGIRMTIGAFEVASILVLTTVLRIYWQGPLAVCTAVSFGWVAALAIIFRLIFHVQLP